MNKANQKLYPKPALPGVNYSQLKDSFEVSDKLTELEYSTLENCCHFLENLKKVFMKAKMVQTPELMVAHLCGYLGAVTVIYKDKKAKQLEPDIINLIKKHADFAYSKFNQYAFHSPILPEDKKARMEALREDSPGSIVVQTLCLSRMIIDMMSELSINREIKLKLS